MPPSCSEKLLALPIASLANQRSISLWTITGCQAGSALKSRIAAQTFRTGAVITALR
jgi:hypothetical protein